MSYDLGRGAYRPHAVRFAPLHSNYSRLISSVQHPAILQEMAYILFIFLSFLTERLPLQQMRPKAKTLFTNDSWIEHKQNDWDPLLSWRYKCFLPTLDRRPF